MPALVLVGARLLIVNHCLHPVSDEPALLHLRWPGVGGVPEKMLGWMDPRGRLGGDAEMRRERTRRLLSEHQCWVGWVETLTVLVMMGNTKMKAYYPKGSWEGGSCTPSRDFGVDRFGWRSIVPTERRRRTVQLGGEGVGSG